MRTQLTLVCLYNIIENFAIKILLSVFRVNYCQTDMLIFGTTDVRYLRSDAADNQYRYPISDHINNAISIVGYLDLTILQLTNDAEQR